MQEYDAAAVHTDALEAILASFSLGGAIDLNMATGFRPTQYSYRLTRKQSDDVVEAPRQKKNVGYVGYFGFAGGCDRKKIIHGDPADGVPQMSAVHEKRSEAGTRPTAAGVSSR